MVKSELDALVGGNLIYGQAGFMDRIFVARFECAVVNEHLYLTGGLSNNDGLAWVDEPYILANYDVTPSATHETRG